MGNDVSIWALAWTDEPNAGASAMADLSNYADCVIFIKDWRKHYGEIGAEAFRRKMRLIACEQQKNLKEAKRLGRNVEEYYRAVQMLKAAASE